MVDLKTESDEASTLKMIGWVKVRETLTPALQGYLVHKKLPHPRTLQ